MYYITLIYYIIMIYYITRIYNIYYITITQANTEKYIKKG